MKTIKMLISKGAKVENVKIDGLSVVDYVEKGGMTIEKPLK